MRIAHIGPAHLAVGYSFGSAVERRMVDLAWAQQDRGDTVLVFSVAPSTPLVRPQGPARDLRIIDIPCRLNTPLSDMELVLRIRGALLRVRPDVIHVHNNVTASMGLAGIGGLKVLGFDHFRFAGSERPVTKALLRRALTAFDLLLASSDLCLRGAAEYWSLPLSDLRALHTGLSEPPLVIGCVGRLRDQAEADILTEAMELVKTVHPAVTLTLAGSRAADDVLRSFDICVMSGPQAFGVTAAQVLSLGTPVVSGCAGHLGGSGSHAAAALAEELIALCDEHVAPARMVAQRADALYREALS